MTKVILALILFCTQSFAFLELRGTGGLHFVNPDMYNKYLNQNGIKSIFTIGTLGGDFLLGFPTKEFGIAFGVRIEKYNIKVLGTSLGSDNYVDFRANRTAALLLIKMPSVGNDFFGEIVGSWGLKTDVDIDHYFGGQITKIDSAKTLDWSAGIAGGMSYFGAKVGSEVGYHEYILSDPKGPGGNSSYHINAGGFYVTLMIGLSLIDGMMQKRHGGGGGGGGRK